MAEDELRIDAGVAETLGAFGTRPLLDGTSDPGAAPSDPTPESHLDEGRPEPDESRLARLVGWVRWAAAPLGFFLFLSALTAYGVLRDREGSGTTNSQPSAAAATTAVPATAAPTRQITVTPTTSPQAASPATTVPDAPTALSSAAPRAASPPAPAPPAASPPAPSPSGTSGADPARSTATGVPVRYFGPACGHAPGQTIAVMIDGRRQVPATADANGCVSLTYWGPECGYVPGEMVELVINGRPQLPVRADADGCVSATR
jgi:hypothetical protein